jgi:hypothetical protein
MPRLREAEERRFMKVTSPSHPTATVLTLGAAIEVNVFDVHVDKTRTMVDEAGLNRSELLMLNYVIFGIYRASSGDGKRIACSTKDLVPISKICHKRSHNE